MTTYCKKLEKEGMQSALLFSILLVYPFCYKLDTFLSEITALFIVILVLFLGNCILLYQKTVFNISKPDLPFLLFLFYCGGRFWSMGIHFDEWSVIQFVTYILIYICFRSFWKARQFFLYFFYSGLIQATWSVLQLLNILPSNHYILSGTGTFFNPAILGIFLVLSLLSGINIYNKNFKMYEKLFWWMSILFLFFCIIISNSRASWFALLIGVGWILFKDHQNEIVSYFKAISLKKRFLKFSIFLSFSIIIVFIILYSLYAIRPDSVHGRFLVWQVIGSKIIEAPWIGQGPIQALYMPGQAEWFQDHPNSPFIQVAGNNIYAFNEFLRIMFESGIIGLILVIGLLGTAWIYVLKGNRFSRQAGALLLAMIGFGMFGYPLSIELLTILGIIILSIISRNTTSKPIIVFHVHIAVKWVIFLFCFFFLFVVIKEYHLRKNADQLLQEAQYNPTVLTGNEMIHFYGELKKNPDFMLCYGRTLYDHRFYTNALTVLEQAYHLRPSAELMCDLGYCYQYNKQYSEAEEAFHLAAWMTPAFILPQYRLFSLYKEIGELEKAMEKARYMLSMSVKVVNTSVIRYRHQANFFLKNQESVK